MAMNLFDYLSSLTDKKRPLDEDELKGYPIYMINRFVSMVDMYVPIVNELNLYQMDASTHHEFLRAFLPKRRQYFKYIKKNKEDVKQSTRDAIMKYFQVGPRDADLYLDILTEKQAKEIENLYK